MFGPRTVLLKARTVATGVQQSSFHTSAAALAKPRRSRKDIVIQVRKANLQKQLKKQQEFEASVPDYIVGKPTEFTRSILSSQSMFKSPLPSISTPSSSTDSTTSESGQEPLQSLPEESETAILLKGLGVGSSKRGGFSSSIFGRTPLQVSTSNPSGYQHFLSKEEANLVFGQVPQLQTQDLMDRSSLVSEKFQLPIEKQKAELVRRITALENGNAKQIGLENVRRAVEAFKRQEGDTGSPEVQAAVMTVRIHNLNNHVQSNRKDKHNYRRLRMLIHQRQTVLKYLKSKDADRYHVCLDRLGLEPRAIEDEIVI